MGTTPRRAVNEMFGRRGLRDIRVPYKDTSKQMLAVSSEQVMVGSPTLQNITTWIASGCRSARV